MTLHGYAKDEARAIKEQPADWLRTTLKLTLNTDKTAITHWSERVLFLGFELRGIKSWVNGASRPPHLLIPQVAEARVRHTVARLTRRTPVEPGDMIEALNRVLRGWMQYYCYAANARRVFARVLSYAFWALVRYVNKRHKVHGARKALRRYYGTIDGKKAFVYTSPTTSRQVGLIRSIGRKALYDLKRAEADVDRVPTPWMVYSASIGRSPWQRMEVRTIQDNCCAQCANPVEEIHHRTALRKKTNRVQAGYETHKTGLCHACHQVRTRQQRGQVNRESRMLPK